MAVSSDFSPLQAGIRPLRLAGMWRGLLIAGSVLAVGVAVWAGGPPRYALDDVALARLLRAMAVIKGMGVLAAMVMVGWRLGWHVRRPVAAGYVSTVWLMAGSTALIWQRAYLPLGAMLFHGALLALLLIAWKDDGKHKKKNSGR